jgi:aryl-alcohol dehydrogenase-like predicted oxidoreductase
MADIIKKATRESYGEALAELAEKYDVSMTEISLAWILPKVTSPVVGATKYSHVDGAVNAVELNLTADDVKYLEEPYVAHDLVGVMADNKATASDNEKVWQKHTINKI